MSETSLEPSTSAEAMLGVGEILICNTETKGTFESLKCFIGKVILTIGGGGDKIYVVEQKDRGSVIKSIQSRSMNDTLKLNQSEEERKGTEGSEVPPPENKENQKNENKPSEGNEEEGKENEIIQICKGKYHLIKLTSDWKVRCSGKPYFGVTGLGGAAFSETTKMLPNLADKKIIQVSAGEFHSLALADNGDLYTWGMGFQGQLGLSKDYLVASSPRYLNFFYRKPVKFISCGHNYSLALTKNGDLYGWGENKLGQLGLGHQQIYLLPTHIPILDKDGEQEGCSSSESLVNQQLERQYTNQPLKCCYVSAGYSHTVVVTEQGYPVTFGLNVYGQLGLGNTKTSFEPRLLQKDYGGENIEQIVKSACSTSGTFLISKTGKLYTCGSGNIGHGFFDLVKLPKLIGGQRLYSHIFCNDHTVVAFCPLRILSVSPNCGPATGGTILSIIGSAFKEFAKLRVRFIFGGVSRDVSGNFDKLSRTIFVHTPNFIEYCPNMELPCPCTIQVTFDGSHFTEYAEKFLIYPNSIKISAIEPKCGPISGETPLLVKINLDQIPQKYLFSLTIGFQAKPVVDNNQKRKMTGTGGFESKSSTDNNVSNNNPAMIDAKNAGNNVINPMDMEKMEGQLDKANWYCCFSTYENGVMTCNIPQIENFSQNQVEYNVDVAINGQQFSGFPMIYRFYDIKVEEISPNISKLDTGLTMKITGQGLFDSVNKKAKFSSEFGERYTEIQWERKEKCLTLSTIPLKWWISEDDDLFKPENAGDLYNKYNFNVSFSMNGTQWIEAGHYKYCEPEIKRIVYYLFDDKLTQNERIAQIAQKEEITEDEILKFKGDIPDAADKKRLTEFEKKRDEEDNMIQNSSKRPYTGLILYGPFFPEVDSFRVKFTDINTEEEEDTFGFYRNSNSITCLIPEIKKLEPGVHELAISFAVNGDAWIETDKKINFNAPEEGLPFEELVKNEDDKKKKPGKK